jgi:hypothetical protein
MKVSFRDNVDACAVGIDVRAVAALGFALVLLAFCAGGAAAAPSSTSSVAAGGRLCTTARGVATDILKSTSVGNGQVVTANIKTTYLKIVRAEPSLLAASTGPIKSDLRQVFGFVNLAVADLKKVNWKTSALRPYAPTLLARAAAVQRPLHALKIYFTRTCKFKA